MKGLASLQKQYVLYCRYLLNLPHLVLAKRDLLEFGNEEKVLALK